MREYSVEEVREMAGALLHSHKPRIWKEKAARMLLAFAERIKSDESAVPDEVKLDLLACDWQEGDLFGVRDEPGEHDPCYLILPSNELIPFVHHAVNGVDQARAQFIADCCNQVLSTIKQPLFTHPPAQAAQFDRARETPRRQQAVETMLELGWTYNAERGWEEQAQAARCDKPGCNCAAWLPDGCAWDTAEPVATKVKP